MKTISGSNRGENEFAFEFKTKDRFEIGKG